MKKTTKTPKAKMDPATDLWRRALPHLRRNMKLSQAELAALAGISQQSLSKFEDGSRALSEEAFWRLEGAIQKAQRDRKADAENNWGMKSLGLPDETPEQREDWERIIKESDEQLAELVERIKTGDLSKQLDPYKALLKEPWDAPKILQGFKELLAMVEQIYRNFERWTARDYAMFPRSLERGYNELKAENAKLREALEKGKTFQPRDPLTWAFELAGILPVKSSPPLATGHEEVTTTPDDTDKEKPKGGE